MSNADVPENTQFQDLVESLKMNKEVKGLAKYLGEHILLVMNTVQHQKIKEVLDYLEKRYRRTRLENLEELMLDWMKFNVAHYDNEDELLQAMGYIQMRKEELKGVNKVWFSV